MADEIRVLFDRARREVDLPALVSRYVRVRRSGSRDDYRCSCPLHNGDNPAAFHVYRSPKTGRWGWTCHTHCGSGSVIDFEMIIGGGTPVQALERLLGGVVSSASRVSWTPAAPPRPEPALPALPIDRARRFNRLLPRSLSTGESGVQWWRNRGVSERAIADALLGYCPRCPTMFDPDRPDRTFDSMTIPIFGPDGDLVNLRHRVLAPPNPKDKYRPDRKGSGLWLYGAHWLRPTDERILIVEGEIKALVLRSYGLSDLIPVVSGTGGSRCWLGVYGDRWYDMLAERLPALKEVHVLFDPDGPAQEAAWHTARRFGRRGRVIPLAEKVDDWLQAAPDDVTRLGGLINAIANSRPVTQGGYWAGVARVSPAA